MSSLPEFQTAVLERLVTTTFLAKAEHHARLVSTNDLARQRAEADNACQSLLILADEQTAGRGRGKNRWWTGPGSLAFSLLIHPAEFGIARAQNGLLSLATAVAIVDTVAPRLPRHEVGLHWPNDVFAAGRKLAGILVEALADGRHIVGIGLNTNNTALDAPPEIRHLAITMRDLSGQSHPHAELLHELLTRLGHAWEGLGSVPETVGKRFNALCLQRGEKLTLDTGQSLVDGLCHGVALDGALILHTADGPRSFYAGVLRKGPSSMNVAR